MRYKIILAPLHLWFNPVCAAFLSRGDSCPYFVQEKAKSSVAGHLDALANNILVVEPAAGLPQQHQQQLDAKKWVPNNQLEPRSERSADGWGRDEESWEEEAEDGWGGGAGDSLDLDCGVEVEVEAKRGPMDPSSQESHAFTDIALDSPRLVSSNADCSNDNGSHDVYSVSAAELAKVKKDNAMLRRSNADLMNVVAVAEKVS
jgi:hypothetical protein